MAEVSAQEVLDDLKKGKFSPVYFLQGEESFYIDEITSFIEKNALDDMQKGFNQTVMYGKDHDMNAVLMNAKRFPMMSDRQVVIVKEAQDLKDLGKESGDTQLANYIKNPLPSTILVFAHKNKTLDGKKSLPKLLKKEATVVTTKKLYDNQIPAWILEFVKAKGYKISQKAQFMIAESVGSDLSKLANEINKVIINFSQPGAEITEEHVQKYIGVSKDYNVFELQNALAKKDILKANKIVLYFEKNPKDNPLVMVVPSLYTYFTKLLLIHTLDVKSDVAVGQALKIHPFIAKDFLTASKLYPLEKLYQIFHALQLADLKNKGIQSGSESDGEILKELVFKILH